MILALAGAEDAGLAALLDDQFEFFGGMDSPLHTGLDTKGPEDQPACRVKERNDRPEDHQEDV